MRTITLLPLFLTSITTVTACLTEAELNGNIHHPSRTRPLMPRQSDDFPPPTNNGTVPVGTGDRFRNGTVPPRGIGSRNYTDTLDLSTIPELSTVYSAAEIKSALLALQHTYPSQVEYLELPYKTYHNATMYGAKIRSSLSDDNKGYKVLLESAIHARERGGPDYTINFISDLLYADAHSLPSLTYGGASYPLSQIRSVLSLGIIVIPLVNPDGVAHDQATNACWRKNRNPLSQIASDPENSLGVDLNRNFPPVWNFTQALSPQAYAPASFDPSSEIFAGTAPLSEPETQNIDWVLANFPDLAWFLDLHSMATMVLFGWGHDSNQVTDPEMNLLDPKYDGIRGVLPDDPANNTVYKEYIPQSEWDAAAIAAARVAGRMTDATGRLYTPLQAPNLYPTSGSSVDHGRWRKAKGLSKKSVNGLVVEFGEPNYLAECPFYPDMVAHRMNMIEVGTGFMEFLMVAERFDSF